MQRVGRVHAAKAFVRLEATAFLSDRIGDGKQQLRASIVFANLKPGQTQVLSGRRWVWGPLVYVSALCLDDGELLIIITPDATT